MNRILLRVSLVFVALIPVSFGQPADWATISNDRMSIGFDKGTGGLVDVAMADGTAKFVPEAPATPLIWELVFRSEQGEELRLANSAVSAPEVARTGESLVLEWNNLGLKNEASVLDLKVSCDLPAAADTALLRLWVDNRSSRWGLWEIAFPVIRGLGKTGETPVAMGRGTWGRLFRNSGESIRGEYPSHSLPMQFILLQSGDRGLYLAAHDPQARFKTFAVQIGAEFRVVTRAEDMGVAGNDWPAPYPFALAAYAGDWMAGCKKYRAWVSQNGPWTRKGSLAMRHDVPESLTRVCAWLLASGGPDEVAPAVRQFAEAIGAPVGVHWYNWHEIPFDTYYPNYFPTKPGFAEAVKSLVSSGVTVMPYINSRLWDTANENFQAARPASVKNEKGEVTIEEYGSGAKLAVMCPTQSFWQDKVKAIILRLGEECGVNAVYLDQIASAPPRICFDAYHNHSLGSGPWWVDGYRSLLTPIKRWSTAEGRSIGLTSENNAEPYMDNVDAHLIWTQRADDEIPMVTAVYSGYTLYFASNRAFAYGDASYSLCQARDFVWGTQLGWDGVDILKPEHEHKLRFLSRLAKLRAKSPAYFVYGELIDILKIGDQVPQLSGTWDKPGGEGPVTLPAVHAAKWAAGDGSVAVVLANADTAPHRVTFAKPGPQGASAAAWRIERVTADSRDAWPDEQPGSREVSVEIPGRDAALFVFRAADGPVATN